MTIKTDVPRAIEAINDITISSDQYNLTKKMTNEKRQSFIACVKRTLRIMQVHHPYMLTVTLSDAYVAGNQLCNTLKNAQQGRLKLSRSRR